jgi:photosystem II stability/assembly factor-like uncharacterized protein
MLIGPSPPAAPAVAWGDAQHAWAGGAGGIFASGDGGETWRLQVRRPALELAAVDARHAWALSDQGVTARTTDGVHWRTVGVQKLVRISFVDLERGFALGRDDFVLRTDDGGSTWSAPGGPSRLQSICFSARDRGWVARNGTVWTTRDAGAHWSPHTLLRARQSLPVPELSCRGREVWVVLHGGAAAGSEGYAVYRSRDAGTTWRAVYAQFLLRGLPRIDAYAGPLAALGGGDAVLEGSCAPCGSSGRVSFRHGATVTRLAGWLPGPIAFADHRRGLAVLSRSGIRSGVVLRTNDGARTWTRVLASTRLRP